MTSSVDTNLQLRLDQFPNTEELADIHHAIYALAAIVAPPVLTITESASISTNAGIVILNPTSQSFIVTLASASVGELKFRNIGNYDILILGESINIDGHSNTTITPLETLHLIADGTQWWSI